MKKLLKLLGLLVALPVSLAAVLLISLQGCRGGGGGIVCDPVHPPSDQTPTATPTQLPIYDPVHPPPAQKD